jgi:hypothetical protein
MRGFLKLAADRAYATGAIRSNLGVADLVTKLRRAGLATTISGDRLVIDCDGERWAFGNWEPDGVGRIGWLELKVMGHVGGLSERLTEAGVRHRLQYSRPRDLETSDVRSVTEYEYRWDQPGLPPLGPRQPAVVSYDEAV